MHLVVLFAVIVALATPSEMKTTEEMEQALDFLKNNTEIKNNTEESLSHLEEITKLNTIRTSDEMAQFGITASNYNFVDPGASNSLEGTSPYGSITECTQKARVWLYQKNVQLPGPLPQVTVGSEYKHWAVVAEYLDEETGNPDRSELYEAGQQDGIVVASHKAFSESLAKKWMKEKGAEREILATDILDQDAAISFCSEVTKRKDEYTWNKQNCQKFVKEFIERFSTWKLSLPPNAEQSSLGKSKRSSDTVSDSVEHDEKRLKTELEIKTELYYRPPLASTM